MLEHICNCSGNLDFADITMFMQKQDEWWDPMQHSVLYFARAHKCKKQLMCAGIPAEPKARLAVVIDY